MAEFFRPVAHLPGADGKPAFRRHFILEVTDLGSGASREFDVPGGQGASSFTVAASQFPSATIDGHTYQYRLRYRWRLCQSSDDVTHYCQGNQDYDSFSSAPVGSVQDATPPRLTSLVIEGGDFANTLTVRVHLYASDPGQHPSGVSAVQFSADPTFPCPKLGVCGSPFTSEAVVTLRPGSDGLRSVYARVFDSAQAPGGGGDVIGLRDGSFGLPPGNMSEVASASIVLDTTGPKLVVSRSPEPQKAGKPVSFDGSQSVDNGGFNADSGVDVGTAVWDFGDGTKGSGLATTHVYAAAGSYKATLSLRDRVGNQSTLTMPVTIMPSNWGGTGTPTQTVGTPTSSPTQADTTPPALSALWVTRVRGRLRLALTLSEPATLLVQMERLRPRPRITVAARSPSLAAGRNTLLLARLQRHGRYRILVAARDTAGNVSPTRVLLASGPKR